MKKILSYLLILTLTFTMLFSGVSFSFAAETQQPESDPAAGEVYVEDEVLVVFEDEVSEKKAEKIVENTDIETKNVEEVVVPEESSVPEEMPYLVTLDNQETSVDDALENLEKDPDVAYAQPNYLYTTETEENSSVPVNDTYRGKQWNLDYINAEEAWDYISTRSNTSDEPIKIATLDTRILDREDLEINIDRDNCVDATQSDYPRYTNEHPTPSSHGTSVAGTLAADAGNNTGTAGVASGRNNNLIQLMGINVFRNADNYQTQASATTADIVSGLEYATSDNVNAKVINMALGHTRNQQDEGGNHDDKVLEEAIKAASKKAVLIATAGNDHTQSEWLPSDFEDVISVINTVEYKDAWSKDCKAKGSNYGSKKDISAPGSNIWHPKGSSGYVSSSGTSLAAPHVSGVAAMILYVNPTLNPEQVRNILLGTTTDLYTEGYDIYTGYGNVDAYAAVKTAGDAMDNPSAIPNPDRDRDSEIPVKLAKPSGLEATNSEMEQITIKWNKVSDATRYSIYRSENGASGTYKNLATITNGTSYVDNAATYSKTYHYKIRAYGTSSETHKKICSEDSSTVSATSSIPNKLTTPMVKASGTNYKSIKLSWGKISGASQYRVWRATNKNGDFKRIKTITSGKTLSYTDSTCTFGQTYYYKIFARGTRNGKEIRSSGSIPVSATPVLPAPSFKITSVDYKTNKVSWKQVSGASGYRIYRSTSKNGTYSKIKTTTKSTTTSWTDTGLRPGKGYYYKIRPYRKVNGSRRYGTLSAADKHYAKPAKPTFTLKKSGRRVTLTLKKNAKVTGYAIYRKTGKNGKWKKVKTVSISKTKGATYSRKLARGKTYYFKVKAFKKSSGKRVYSVYSSTKKRKI